MKRASRLCIVFAQVAIGGCSSMEDPMPPRLDGAVEPPADGGIDAAFDADILPGSDLALALELLCDAHAYGPCTAPWQCGCDYHGTIAGSPPADVEACVRERRAPCDVALLGQLRDGVAWTLDREASAACVRARRRAYDLCLPPPTASELPRACRDALILEAPLGASCLVPDVRCAEGRGLCVDGSCRALPSALGVSCEGLCALGLACVAGVCSEPVAVGGLCGDHEDCTAPELCVGGRCEGPAAEGEACETDRCASGLVCSGGTCAPEPVACTSADACGATSSCMVFWPQNFCTARRGEGGPCNESTECIVGLECIHELLGGPGACRTPPRRGERCSGGCEGDLRCFFDVGDTSRATCQPPLPLGAPCGRDTVRSFPCEEGLACVARVCSPAPREGEACGDDNLCGAGLFCDVDRVCRPNAREGEGCFSGRECPYPLVCTNRSCTARPVAGQRCTDICAEGLDCHWDDAYADFVCGIPNAPGGECGDRCDETAYCDIGAYSCVPDVCLALFPPL